MKKGDEKLSLIYSYMQNYIDENGFPPSVREICAEFNIKSTSTVHYYMKKLKTDGKVVQMGNKKRAISIASTRDATNYVPLVGDISAGTGILAVENIEGEYPLPKNMFGGDQLFMLRVDGESMIDAGISNGDFVVVRKQQSANIGEIVVALWDDTATVKRLVSTTPNMVLHPENPTMEDIVLPPSQNPTIIGKVVGCIKKF